MALPYRIIKQKSFWVGFSKSTEEKMKFLPGLRQFLGRLYCTPMKIIISLTFKFCIQNLFENKKRAKLLINLAKNCLYFRVHLS